ncbi:MAG: SRPBCC family protein [Acidobacteriota bacterium]
MWQFKHSVECSISVEFAWQFWTDVNNWAVVDPAVEWVSLNGAFATGSQGTTKPRGAQPTNWTLVEVQDSSKAVIEIAVSGAALTFHWKFEATNNGGTKLTQEVHLSGERAEDYLEAVKWLEQDIPAGMHKLVEGIIKVATSMT